MKSGIAKKSLGFIIAVLMAAALLFPVQGFAQETDIPDNQIIAFARAQGQLEQIQVEYEPRIHAATDEAKQHALIQKANREMVQVVEDEGLSVEEFNTIATAIQTDPELRDRIDQELQQ